MQNISFEVRGEFITLDRLLKASGLAPSGGAAKTMVAEGRVQVDGRDELRKTAKLRAGQVVSLTGARIRLLPAGSAMAGAAGVTDACAADDAAPRSERDGPGAEPDATAVSGLSSAVA